MKTIQKPDKDILGIWKAEKPENKTYRMLSYVIETDITHGCLLHNVVTGELVCLSEDETSKIRYLPQTYAPWMDELIVHHYLVSEGSDDKKVVDDMRKIWRTLCARKGIDSYVILPTTACNARCFYCYESETVHESMTSKTADKVVRFIEQNREGRPVRIQWFGGEPLIGLSAIDRISNGLKERNIQFTSNMITNGYLLSSDIAKRMKKDWNIKRVQITLDGTESKYNEIKSYVNACKSPYKRVLNNIDCLIENQIPVVIRLNLGLHNYEDLINLADELSLHFQNADTRFVDVYAQTLYQNCGTKHIKYSDDEVAQLHEHRKELNKHLDKIKHDVKNQSDTASEYNENIAMPCLVHTNCMADWTDNILVTPSGMLTKCEHHIDNRFVGNLDDGIVDLDELERYKKHKTFPRCHTCKLYPNCIYLEACGSKTECPELRMKTIIRGYQQTAKDCYIKALTKSNSSIKEQR